MAMATGGGPSMDVLLLPDELRDEILRRVSLRGIASCRCVCTRWRDAVDDLGLLEKLPRSLTGILINYDYDDYDCDNQHLRFFARRPTSAVEIDSAPKSNQGWDIDIRDLCNGLLLCDDSGNWFVCNPATRQRATLPHPGPPKVWIPSAARTDYLAFDPVDSPHYHVVRFPDPEGVLREDPHAPLDLMEWPPPLFGMRVFSSITWRWEDKEFVREGHAVVTLADVLSGECDELYAPDPWVLVEALEPTNFCHYLPRRRNAVYWRGALYVHCRGHFITRLSLSDDKYQVIKSPTTLEDEGTKSYLGRSEKEVYHYGVGPRSYLGR